MTDLPIPFSPAMARAAYDGRKGQTRRMPKICGHKTISEFGKSDTPGYDWHFRDAQLRWHDISHNDLLARLPYQVGDRLWVREAWRTCSQMDVIPPREMSPYEPIRYEADGFIRELACMMIKPGRFRPPMFMPRWASRMTLIVTDVRVQRLQEISEQDAIAEGVEPYSGIDPYCSGYLNYRNDSEDGHWLTAQNSFRSLWDSLNEARGFGWDANPWVAAYSFTVHRCNIDQMEIAA
ncbi:MAG: hypothetical protein GYB53_23855 [Rhodobacteraceae bacterium]|nr:hypothetical protein [Paracoccaceae bacterium]MBR9823701.1 hypothetical protein [Paracoccaceae bacterium]